MKTRQPKKAVFLIIAVSAWTSLAFAFTGCQSEQSAMPQGAGAKAVSTTPSTSAPGGAQLWAQNCQHCHNPRSPSSYSDAQWEVAMMHMKHQARLTAGESKTILEFLKAGN